ncbi:hypothetical protein [Pseudomonas sp. NPDC099000]|uniref:hypothetical protein n=1 Tax=Pseudomonas sp. NPDC099000 TaxID=3364488 RepID=UPI00383AEE53
MDFKQPHQDGSPFLLSESVNTGHFHLQPPFTKAPYQIFDLYRLSTTNLFNYQGTLFMAKPPKRALTSKTPDTSTTLPRSSSENSRVRGGDHAATVGRPLGDANPVADTNVSSSSQRTLPRQPVVVTDMPVNATSAAEIAAKMISWPRNEVDELFKIADTGLFMSSRQQLYADIGEEGIFLIRTNARGDYQVPLPFAPDQPGPILKKVPGQPQWRIAREGMVLPTASVPARPETLEIIPRHLADKLTPPDANGLRYDKLRRTYVDLADEGTVMVRKNTDGDYQASSTSELTPSGPVLEGIDGMTLWQRKAIDTTASDAEESGPTPGKRPRLDENAEASDTVADNSQPAATLNENPYLWASWGKITKPESVESIKIGQLHYPIVPKGPMADQLPLVFIQHPGFAPSRFEAFERMLHEAPSLQPVATSHQAGTNTRKVDGAARLFEKTLTQQVADVYKGFTEPTSRAVAKRLFELSSESEEFNGSGLARMKQTFRHWEGKSTIGVPRLGDPLDILPVASGNEGARRIVELHAPDSIVPLQQLNFRPESTHAWQFYAELPNAPGRLSLLLASILSHSGYKVFLPANVENVQLTPPTVVFKRPNHNKVYFLKLGRVETDAIEIKPPSVPELADPLLKTRIGAEAHQLLLAADAKGDVVWLIGGVQHMPVGNPSVFIIKER